MKLFRNSCAIQVFEKINNNVFQYCKRFHFSKRNLNDPKQTRFKNSYYGQFIARSIYWFHHTWIVSIYYWIFYFQKFNGTIVLAPITRKIILIQKFNVKMFIANDIFEIKNFIIDVKIKNWKLKIATLTSTSSYAQKII